MIVKNQRRGQKSHFACFQPQIFCLFVLACIRLVYAHHSRNRRHRVRRHIFLRSRAAKTMGEGGGGGRGGGATRKFGDSNFEFCGEHRGQSFTRIFVLLRFRVMRGSKVSRLSIGFFHTSCRKTN